MKLPSNRSADRLPRQLLLATYAVFVAYDVANIYETAIAGWASLVKWMALILIILLSAKAVDRVPGGKWSLANLAAPGAFFFAIAMPLTGSTEFFSAAGVLGSVVLIVLAGRFVAGNLTTVERKRQFFNVILNLGRLVILSAAVMWVLGLNLGRGSPRFSAWTDNPNTLGLLLAPVLVILMARAQWRWKWLFRDAPLLVIGLFILLKTESRAAMLWVLSSMLALRISKTGFGLASYAGALALVAGAGWYDEIAALVKELLTRKQGVTFSRNADVLSGRTEVWQLGLRLFDESPIFGHGLGSSARLIEESSSIFVEHQGANFHNSYLSIAVEAGIVGLTAFCILVSIAVLRGADFVNQMQRARNNDWASEALAWALLIGALAHAFYESWLISAGNANALLLWTCIWLLFDIKRRKHFEGSGRAKNCSSGWKA
jgi:O-antigen ligase